MINILSYVGLDMQSELYLWTLLGLLRTIFDATLFKVNANLKQVWQMSMPAELSLPLQRVLRTMISGIMLVQCFTVYIYLASYIVLLYPIFLEERPTLVLPWLLLAAIRKLLCELLSLTLGLGTCLLVGPARPPCVTFVVTKIGSIMPSFYMWMLILNYYHTLKVSAAFRTFSVVLPPNDIMNDCGLELAIRRRCTKSLWGEKELRRKMLTGLYTEAHLSMNENMTRPSIADVTPLNIPETDPEFVVDKADTASENNNEMNNTNESDTDTLHSLSPRLLSDIRTHENWFGDEIIVPRDTDRITEQFGVMLLRISTFLTKEDIDQTEILQSDPEVWSPVNPNIDCGTLPVDVTDTPPFVGSNQTPAYLTDYPQIFMKKTSDQQQIDSLRNISQIQSYVGADSVAERGLSEIGNNAPPETKKTVEWEKVDKAARKLKYSMKEGNKSNMNSQTTKIDEVANTEGNKSGKSRIDNFPSKPDVGDGTISSSSLSSIINRMRIHLAEVKSRKENTPSGISTQETEHSKENSTDDQSVSRIG